jgi:hypothetical protein
MSMTVLIVAIGFTALALIVTIVWLLKASGLFTSIRIKIAQPAYEDLTVAYKFQKGDYSTSADIFRDILNYSPSHSTIGIYYDNPNDVRMSSGYDSSSRKVLFFLSKIDTSRTTTFHRWCDRR